jgi:RHS repeat protein
MTDTVGTTTYTYPLKRGQADDANRLTNIEHPNSSTQTYTWDDRGNLTHDGVFTYTYSAAWCARRA